MRPGVVVAVVSMLLAHLWPLASPASSLVAGLERVTATSISNSAFNKAIIAYCSGAALGAGARIIGGGGQVILQGLLPDPDTGRALAYGREDHSGYQGNWQLRALAICAAPLSGLERVHAFSPSNSTSPKSVSVACPAGKKVISAGAYSQSTDVIIEDVLPSFDLKRAIVTAYEDEAGTTGNWSLAGYAACADPLTGLERVWASSAFDSTSPKSVAVSCPPGKKVLGTGVTLAAGEGQVALTDVLPSADLTSVSVTAYEDENGTAADWRVTAYATCVDPNSLGLVRITSTSAYDSSFAKSALATCPSGMELLGHGGEVVSGTGRVVLHAVDRSVFLNWAQARATEDDSGTAGAWLVKAYAVCGDPLFGLEAVSEFSGASSQDKFVSVTCGPGKKLLGLGGRVETAQPGPSVDGDVVIDDVIPSGDLDTVKVWGREDEGGTTEDWRVLALGICAPPPPGLERVAGSSGTSAAGSKVAEASCPPGKMLTGVGGAIIGGDGEVMIDRLQPSIDLKTARVLAQDDEDGRDQPWGLSAYGICVTST